MRETGTGQQVAQLHDRYMMMMIYIYIYIYIVYFFGLGNEVYKIHVTYIKKYPTVYSCVVPEKTHGASPKADTVLYMLVTDRSAFIHTFFALPVP
jgi:hypothetical protein